MPNKTFSGTFKTAVDLGKIIEAADGGQLPAEIPVLPKGEFMTMPYGNMVLDDKVFNDMIANFDRTVRRATPVDVDHAMNGETKAAGWVKSLINKADGLWASIKWNKLGKELVGEEIYKMISAEWSFDYIDPQTSAHYGAVLVAATLTNRPLMQSMPTITASSNKDLTNPNGIMILLSSDSKKEKTMPTLIDILKKPVADRNDEDLKFLKENEADLTDEQKTQLDTEVADAKKAEDEKAQADLDAAKAKEAEEAAAKAKAEAEAAGKGDEDKEAANKDVTIKAGELARLQKLEADNKAAEALKATESFISPFMANEKGGKVLPAGKEAITKLVASLNAEQKELLKVVLEKTADQKVEGVKGDDDKDGLTATEQYTKLLSELMASKDGKKGLTPSQANKEIRENHTAIYKAYTEENK